MIIRWICRSPSSKKNFENDFSPLAALGQGHVVRLADFWTAAGAVALPPHIAESLWLS